MMDAIAKKSKFELTNISVSEDLSGKINLEGGDQAVQDEIIIHQTRVSLNFIGGGYNDMKRMLSVIEQNLRIMDINSLNFTLDFDGKTTYFVTLTTYYIEE